MGQMRDSGSRYRQSRWSLLCSAAEGSEVNCPSALALRMRAAILLWKFERFLSSDDWLASRQSSTIYGNWRGPRIEWCIGTEKRARTTSGCNQIEMIRKNDH